MGFITLLFLALISALFFVAERSLNLFSWSRLEEIIIPRRRRMAVEECLMHREIVSLCFLVCGTATIVAVAAGFVLNLYLPDNTMPKASSWRIVGETALFAFLLIWVFPELVAWRLRDKVVLFLVPPLYRLAGMPFRFLRALIVQSNTPSVETASSEGEGAAETGTPDVEAHDLFRTALRLRHTQVREIMTPRTGMVSISDTAILRQAAELALSSGYSRLPIFRGNRDQIIGILYVKDLLGMASTDKWEKPGLADLMRPPFFVPETKAISDLLGEFLRSNTHIGIVLDEYGGTSGLVTLEDVMEELVGEIRDEYEDAEASAPVFQWIDDRIMEAQAAMRVDEFNEESNFDLPQQEDFATLGGFVTFAMGKIPAQGGSFEFHGARFTVLEADLRRVIRVRVEFAGPIRPQEKN